MSNAAVGEIYEVRILGKIEEQDCVNVWHFECIQANSSLETLLLQALLECWVALIPQLSSFYRFTGVDAKRVSPTLGPLIDISPAAGDTVQGEASGDGTVSFASCCISIHTTRGGKSGRGRKYLGGIPESATVGSRFITENPYWAAILAFLTCVAGKFIFAVDPIPGSAYFHLGVMSREIGGPKPPYLPAGFARATRLKPNDLIKSTRSRQVGKGS